MNEKLKELILSGSALSESRNRENKMNTWLNDDSDLSDRPSIDEQCDILKRKSRQNRRIRYEL